jgi:two-component system CheB/CheR fusion protein
MALLAFAVREGGFLFLGNTESLGAAEPYFETVSKRWRIHRRVGPLQHRMDTSLTMRKPADGAAPERHSPGLHVAVPVRDDRSTLRYERALLEEFALLR